MRDRLIAPLPGQIDALHRAAPALYAGIIPLTKRDQLVVYRLRDRSAWTGAL